MRILFQTRPDHDRRIGGDRLVMEVLQDVLKRRGLQVDISPQPEPDLSPYDAVHLFNIELIAHTFRQGCNALRQQRPYFFSPIYWPPRESAPLEAFVGPEKWLRRHAPTLLLDTAAIVAASRGQHFLRTLTRFPHFSRRKLSAMLLQNADTVMVCGRAEAHRVQQDFPELDPARITEARFGCRNTEPRATSAQLEPGYFLCVGAIGPRKNQLNIARAMRELPGARLLFVGQTAPYSSGYRRAVETAAPAGTMFLPEQAAGSLATLIRHARAVVQASFIELPGLVTMEALAAGRPVVVSEVPPVREYFDGLATFCDPADPASIREACLSAPAPARAAVNDFRARHDWERVAVPVVEAYRALARRLGR